MIRRVTSLIALVSLTAVAPALAETSDGFRGGASTSHAELPAYLQCVPYAREVSGIQIYGDAHSWWDQAEGRYERGRTPKVGAVMAFQPHRNMRLGHVAAVSKVIDNRTVLLDHANWSPINGRRGQIERNVKAIDVSPNNDWSEVRVWYAPVQGLGTTPWPVHGFIYSKGAPQRRLQVASAPAPRVVSQAPATSKASSTFTQAFASLDTAPQPVRARPLPATVQRTRAEPVRVATRPASRPAARPTVKAVDPLEAAVLRYGN
ncbi:MAG: CHAP domain-containing protein [Sphingomonadaceae bacterium]|nr:CHAP domain-containing protein [Sphingomonadaceae bacterium]MCP5391834.1 CHAP domain-containing protein [Sphingomonadaceae bacterium]